MTIVFTLESPSYINDIIRRLRSHHLLLSRVKAQLGARGDKLIDLLPVYARSPLPRQGRHPHRQALS